MRRGKRAAGIPGPAGGQARLRLASMTLGSCEMRASRRPRAAMPGISMVRRMLAVLSSLSDRVLTASTLIFSLSSTWETSRSRPERS